MKRRSFLKRGLLGGALLTVGGATFFGLKGGPPGAAPVRELHVVDAELFGVLAAVAAACHIGADGVEVAHAVDVNLLETSPETQADYNRVLGLIQNALAALPLRGSLTHFTALDVEGQRAALLSMRDSRLALLRSAYGALKRTTGIAHYQVAKNAAFSGYRGPIFQKPAAAEITSRGALSPPWTPT